MSRRAGPCVLHIGGALVFRLRLAIPVNGRYDLFQFAPEAVAVSFQKIDRPVFRTNRPKVEFQALSANQFRMRVETSENIFGLDRKADTAQLCQRLAEEKSERLVAHRQTDGQRFDGVLMEARHGVIQRTAGQYGGRSIGKVSKPRCREP